MKNGRSQGSCNAASIIISHMPISIIVTVPWHLWPCDDCAVQHHLFQASPLLEVAKGDEGQIYTSASFSICTGGHASGLDLKGEKLWQIKGNEPKMSFILHTPPKFIQPVSTAHD